MKILAFSDCHGQLPMIDTKFDLLLIGGDICPTIDHNYEYQRLWLINKFVPWINNLPFQDQFSKVIFTPGNHDLYFENETPSSSIYLNDIGYPCNGRFVYLLNQKYIFDYLDNGELKQLIIFGTPYCKMFGNWSFMEDDDTLTNIFTKIPDKCDILLTHDAPFGCSDICYQCSDKHLGNIPLRNAILQKNPSIVIHGHLHSSNHSWEKLGLSKIINVSLLNEQYLNTFPILELNDNFEKITTCNLDDCYQLTNRYKNNVFLCKTGCDYTLHTNAYYISEHFDENGKIFAIDPEGGPFLNIGAQWFDFEIKNIKSIGNDYVFELEKLSNV